MDKKISEGGEGEKQILGGISIQGGIHTTANDDVFTLSCVLNTEQSRAKGKENRNLVIRECKTGMVPEEKSTA